MPEKNTISACLVVHNEEKLIGRCLESIKNLVDEIIVVHDGPCQDKTLEIAMNFTNKIFEREQIGSMEPHLAFAYNNSHSEWMMRIDADEFFEQQALSQIKQLVEKAPEKSR